MKKRILSILLALIMLTSMAAGCASDTDGGADDAAQNQGGADDTAAAEPEIPASDILEIPADVNYEGDTITYLVSTGTNWGNENIVVEELTGETINDSIYNRNIAVEEKLNIVLEQIDCKYDTMQNEVSNVVHAGTGDFDIVMPRLFYYAALAQEGMLLNVDSLEHVNTDKVWWDDTIRRDLSVLGNLYALVGDMHMYANDATWIMLFSKDLYNDLGYNEIYGSVYDIVKDGKWTFDKFTEIMKDVTFDLDGDSTLTEKDQIAHLAANNNPIFAFISAAGESMYKKTETDISLNIASDSFITVVDQVIRIMNDDYMTLNTYSTEKWGKKAATLKGNNQMQKNMFGENRVLFRSEVLDVVDQYSDLDLDFGIIPYPKYNESQKDYVSIIIPDVVVTSVPVDCKESDKISVVLETMASLSRDTVRTAYYDVTLQRKNARDEESSAMLDIIFSNRMYMFDMVFDWGGLKNKIIESVNNAQNDMATIAASLNTQISNEISKTLEAFKSVN